MKRLLLISLLLGCQNSIRSDVAENVLEKYPNEVFFGTGIGACVNIARALNANFLEIYSVESDDVLVDHSYHVIPIFIDEKPRKLKNYFVYLGDAQSELADIIKVIKTPITFLLNSYLPDVDNHDKVNGILLELDQIKKHPIKTHTILIDYIHYEGTSLFGNISLEDIKNKLLEINPAYQFRFEKGGHLEKEENAILAAYM